MRSEPVGNARFSAFNKEILLTIKLDQGTELTVAAHKSETVHDLKKRVLGLCPGYTRSAHFFYKGVGLNELKTLKMYGIAGGEVLFLTPWKGDLFSRTGLARFFPAPMSDIRSTVTVHTPRGQELQVDVLGSDTVRVLWEKVKRISRFELFHSHEFVLGRQVLQGTVEMRDLGLESIGSINIVLSITIKVTSIRGANWTLKVLESDPIGRIRENVCDEPEMSDKVSIFCEQKELNDSLTFDLYHIRPHMQLYGKLRMPLTIQTSSGPVTFRPFLESTIWKVAFEAAVLAGLNPYDRYQIIHDGAPLNDYNKLSDAGIGEAAELELTRLGTPPTFAVGPNGVAGQLVLAAVLKQLLEPAVIIATKKNREELMWEGFTKEQILDPLELFRAMMMHGDKSDYPTEDVQTVEVRLDIFLIPSIHFTITLSRYEVVDQLKAMIEARTNYPKYMQKLLFNGGFMNDEYSLNYYSVTDGSMIGLLVTPENSYWLLPSDILDSTADQDFTEEEDYGDAGVVGGQTYYPPYGWKRYGFKVASYSDGTAWTGIQGNPGEWPVAYHSLQRFFSYQEIASSRENVFTAADIKQAERQQTPFLFENRRIKFAFQSKVNPHSIHTESGGQIYASPRDFDVRAFCFLFKFCSAEE